MKLLTKFLAILFMMIPFSVNAATIIKAHGQIRTRIIAFTNTANIVDSIMKNMAKHPLAANIDNLIIGTTINRQDADFVNIEVIF